MKPFKPSWESLGLHEVPKWYEEAKFGIFIHWGLYSVPAWATPTGELGKVPWDEWYRNNPYAEWYLNTLRIKGSPTERFHIKTYGENFAYEKFADIWKAENWNPDEWAELFESIGARYVVITTKHHDGFCLWNSSYTDYSVVKRGPSVDVVNELQKSVRKRGIRFGVYYSGALDWRFTRDPIEDITDMKLNRPVTYEYADYAFNQFMELVDLFRPDVLWNDIGWVEKGRDMLKVLFAHYYNTVPEGLVNDRWEVPHWDFRTAEYNVEKYEGNTPPKIKWEFCRGIGYSFGYNRVEDESIYATSDDLIKVFVKVISNNGNFLLNIGPAADGAIPKIQLERIKKLGRWIKINQEAIFSTSPYDISFSRTNLDIPVYFTRRSGKIFAFLLGDIGNQEITLKDIITSQNADVRVIGSDVRFKIRTSKEGARLTPPKDFNQRNIVLELKEDLIHPLSQPR